MADLVITPANLVLQSNTRFIPAVAGEGLNAGAPVWFDSVTQRWFNADADSVVIGANAPRGLVMAGVVAGAPFGLIIGGGLAFGAILTVGVTYYLSKNPGRIAPLADISGGNAFAIGIARTTSIMELIFENAEGVV